MNARALGNTLILGGVMMLGCLAPRAARADEAYSVEAPTASGAVNKDGTLMVAVKPGKGYHFNKDFPTALKLVAIEDVATPTRLDKASPGVKVAEDGASFEVKFTPKAAGKKSISGTLNFAVCTATTCDPRRVPVTLNIDVK